MTRFKVCSKCSKTKALCLFNNNKESKDGHSAQCQMCERARKTSKHRRVKEKNNG